MTLLMKSDNFQYIIMPHARTALQPCAAAWKASMPPWPQAS